MVKVRLSEGNENCKYALDMCRKILSWFEDSGVCVMSNVPLLLSFDDSINCPKFISSKCSNTEYDRILIKLSDDTKWNQLLFQLSHEVCHYVIYLNNCDDYHLIPWIEESICEAFSLFCLKKWGIEWKSLGYYSENKTYGRWMISYQTSQMKEKSERPSLMDNINLSTLEEINDTATSHRLRRHDFVYKLTELISKQSILGLIDYQKYHKTKLLLDTENYRTMNNSAVDLLCDVQDNIKCL